jgi:hypothetical protein
VSAAVVRARTRPRPRVVVNTRSSVIADSSSWGTVLSGVKRSGNATLTALNSGLTPA